MNERAMRLEGRELETFLAGFGIGLLLGVALRDDVALVTPLRLTQHTTLHQRCARCAENAPARRATCASDARYSSWWCCAGPLPPQTAHSELVLMIATQIPAVALVVLVVALASWVGAISLLLR